MKQYFFAPLRCWKPRSPARCRHQWQIDHAAEKSPRFALAQSRTRRRHHGGSPSCRGDRCYKQPASGSPSAAASVLRRLARVALVQSPVAVPGPGQYLYMQYESSYLHKAPTAAIGASPSDGSQESYTYFQIDREQVWASSSRYGEWIENLGPPTFLSPSDTAAWVADGSPTIPTGTSASKLGPDSLYSVIPTLPTDPGGARQADLEPQHRKRPSRPCGGLRPGR